MNNNKVGKFIATLRKEKHLTQKQLADKLFVTDKAVSKWERGLSFPDVTILERLSNVLEADVSEILFGERGMDKKINVQEEMDKAIKKVEENKLEKKRLIKRKIKRISLIILLVLFVLVIAFISRYKYYHPSVIKEGDNHYELGFFGVYNLEKNGLDEFIKIMNKTENKNGLNANVSWINISLSKSGNVKSVDLSINYFNDEYKYVGMGHYTYKDRNLNYMYEKANDRNMLVEDYAKSLNIKYLSDNIKKIPFKEQIKLSNLKFYEVSLYPNEKFDSSTNVFDMRNNKNVKALTFSDYKNGKGGTVDAGIYLVIALNDGSSRVADETYRYVFDTVDGDVKRTDYTMQTDYYINGQKQLMFTRDYGNSWIKTDLSANDVKETLNFYRDISLKNSSWFISTNELIPIAYFYGVKPKLKISNDNGVTWYEKSFDVIGADAYKEITRRIVGFNDQNFGYVALGTDWSMGSGEYKKAFLTYDGGINWEGMDLPENCTSKTLMDFIMNDENVGVVLLNNNARQDFPYMYITTDKGKNWQMVDYAYEIDEEIDYVTNIDSIEKKDNEYFIVLSQGDYTTKKIKLRSGDLINWRFDSTFTSNIHTVG